MLATALVLAAGVLATAAITLGSIVDYEWMLVVLIARPMLAFLLVFATIPVDHG